MDKKSILEELGFISINITSSIEKDRLKEIYNQVEEIIEKRLFSYREKAKYGKPIDVLRYNLEIKRADNLKQSMRMRFIDLFEESLVTQDVVFR